MNSAGGHVNSSVSSGIVVDWKKAILSSFNKRTKTVKIKGPNGKLAGIFRIEVVSP